MRHRFGRKRVLVGSQLGLFVVGVGIGLAPTYPIFAVLKVVVGFFQQVGATIPLHLQRTIFNLHL